MISAIAALLLTHGIARGSGPQDGPPVAEQAACWIGTEEVAPRNCFTWFRKVVRLEDLPQDGTLRFAADSNGQLWINGHALRRKVARYAENRITAEVVDALPVLRRGANVIVVLHHNWGPITTFQRTGNERAGLYVESSWLGSDATWKQLKASQFVPHDRQILAVNGRTPRIRYPQIVDGARMLSGIHGPAFDDSAWGPAVVISDGPWPARPADVETPGQEEEQISPPAVLAAGTAERAAPPIPLDPADVGPGLRASKCSPEPEALRRAEAFLAGAPLVLEGAAGTSRFVTFDFQRPVHGYPFLQLADADPGVVIDFGYGEVARSIYTGELLVDESGWIDTGAVVGALYADRYLAAAGPQVVELPDERTARWLALHVHFPREGRVVLRRLGFVSSQYPFPVNGSFNCGDERLDAIVRLGLIHARVSMTDAYIDTPGREDGQWYEDAQLRAVLTARWSGDTRLRRFLLRTVAESQLEDGHLHAFPPSNYPLERAPFDWSMQWAAVLYDEYRWSGDLELVRHHFDTLVRYCKALLEPVDEQGLWRTDFIFADIRVGVHPRAGESSGIVTPWVVERLRASAEMAEAIGESEPARAWRAAAERIAAAFRIHHLVPASEGVPLHVGDRFAPQDPQAERGFSQAGQTVAVYADLLTREQARAVLEHAFPAPAGSPPSGVTRWNNPTYFYRALKALSHVGLTERALSHLIERFSPYLPGDPANPVPERLQGPWGGPLPEYFVNRRDLGLEPGELCSAQPDDETGSHGWAAVPLVWLHETLLGVTLREPGGGKLRIAPRTGGLPFVEGRTITPRGAVDVTWRPDERRLVVALPAGVEAELVLPELLRRGDLLVNGVRRGSAQMLVLSAEGATVIEALSDDR